MSLTNRFSIVALCAIAIAACGSPATPQSLTITDGWVRSIMPDAKMTAGYLTMTNNTDANIRLTNVSSPQFAATEIHETTLVDGTMKMRRVTGLDIPAGASVALAPGGQHLMLMGPKDGLDDTTPISIMLGFSDGTGIDLTVPMQRTAP